MTLHNDSKRTTTNKDGVGRHSTWHPKIRPERAAKMSSILRRQSVRRWLSTTLIILMTNISFSQTINDEMVEVSPSQMQTGSLLLKMKSGYVVATRMDTTIDARVNGLVARVTVSQRFRNSGSEWVEGTYVFPLPDNAAVDRLRMHIGERFIEGEIREKEQAKKEYEAAKSAGKKASLVQQERSNMFTTSVANIAPGETVSIEIEYLETVRIDEGIFSIRFPVTTTPRYIPGAPIPSREGSGWSPDTTQVSDASRITPSVVTRATDHRLTFSAALNTGVPLEFVASRYHPIEVNLTGDRYAIALAEHDVPMDHDLELTWKALPDSDARAMIFTEAVEDDTYALLMMLPPESQSLPQTSQQRELILVVDTSGSMHGTSLDQAKRALTLALDGLRPTDRFNVIQFNSVTSVFFNQSVAATTTNVATAKRYVADLRAQGGTEMRSAIHNALSLPANEKHLRQIIFVTDGSVGNEDALFGLIEEQLGNARLFTVGIGSAPNSWFMRKAAEAGRGTFTLISALHEVNEKMERLFRKVEQPQITDITVQWPDGLVAESYPSVVPDLYAGEPVFVRAKLGVMPRETDLVTIRGNTTAGGWSAEVPIAIGEMESGIGALWARARIEELLDGLRRGANEESTRSAVIDTAIEHHLVSKYTSLVAIDKTPVRPKDRDLDEEQIANLLPYGQSTEAIFGFPATATNAQIHLLQGALFLFFGLFALMVIRNRQAHAEANEY